MLVIDKIHGEIGDTLNVGLNATQTPFFMTVDADSMLEPQAIETNIYTLLSRPHTIAIGGGVYLLNGCEYKNGRLTKTQLPTSLVAAFQIGEYLRSFLFGRAGWNMLGGALSYSGTNTLFEKEPVIAVGGYDVDNRAQDAEIIVHLHEKSRREKTPCRIHFTPASFAWTTVPSNLKSYWVQRVHWQMGLLRSFLRYKKMFFNPKYGVTGLFTYPFYMFVEIFGCVIEFIAYAILLISWLLNRLDTTAAIVLFLVSWGFLSFITVAVTAINFISFNKYDFFKDELYMVFLSLFEILGFRQYLIVTRVYGTIKYFFKKMFKNKKR